MDRVLVGKLHCGRCGRTTIHVFSRARKTFWKDEKGSNWRMVSDAMCVNCGGVRLYTHTSTHSEEKMS